MYITRLLPPHAIARQLMLTRGQMRELIDSGQIPVVRVGKHDVRIDVRDVNEWIKESKTAGSVQAKT